MTSPVSSTDSLPNSGRSDWSWIPIEENSPEPSPPPNSPRGLLGARDRLDNLTLPHPPSFTGRAFFQICSLVVQITTALFRLYHWVFPCPHKKVYKTLAELASSGNQGEIKDFLVAQSSKETISGYWLGELLALTELHGHLSEIMQGAHVCLEDEGTLFEIWNQHPNAYNRLSSHPGLERALGHCLFGKIERNGKTCTCFQFERSPLWGGVTYFIDHCIDYLRYRGTVLQQGPAGVSPYIDQRGLVFGIDVPSYFIQRARLSDQPDVEARSV